MHYRQNTLWHPVGDPQITGSHTMWKQMEPNLHQAIQTRWSTETMESMIRDFSMMGVASWSLSEEEESSLPLNINNTNNIILTLS